MSLIELGFIVSVSGLFVAVVGILYKIHSDKVKSGIASGERITAINNRTDDKVSKVYSRMDEKINSIRDDMKNDYVSKDRFNFHYENTIKEFNELKQDNKEQHKLISDNLTVAINKLGDDIKSQISEIKKEFRRAV